VPIHDQGYRRREARAPLRGFRAAPIAALAARQILTRRALIAMLALSLIPFLIAAVVLFFLMRVPDIGAALPRLSDMFGTFLRVQMTFAVLATVWAGTGLVADDFRTGALLVYFSRPLTRRDYVVGKFGVLALLNFALMAVPTLALWALAMSADTRGLFGPDLRFLPVAIVVEAAVAAAVLSILGLAAGAAARSGPLGGVLLVGVLVLFEAAALRAPEGSRSVLLLFSLLRDIQGLEGLLFRMPPDPARLHWAVACACLAAYSAGAWAVLWRRLRAVEVV
jgi:ABC-2 type transport system permease protein